jgi:16S rRNA (adenine1518-N6/adenine1519-N6)-dimethyltransferase
MPPPKVASVLVAFTRRERPPVDVTDERAFFGFVQDAFAHRRKMLGNSLAAEGYDKAAVAGALDQLGLGDRVRPEDLSLESYAALYGALS